MSRTHRQGRFDGVARADSLTWNPHKLMGVLLQCSTLHLKEKVERRLDLILLVTRFIFQGDSGGL